MRIIIAGGTGLIGRALAASLVSDGHQLTILSRREAAKGFPAGVQARRWDGKSAAGWGDLADGVDVIVNLAGYPIGGSGFLPPRWTPKLKQEIFDSRRNSGQAVVEAVRAAKNKPLVVIQASAIGYYGPHDDEPLTEASPAGADFPAKVCVEWEAATAAVAEMGVRYAAIRTGLVLDAHSGVLPRLMLPFKLFGGGPLGSGRQFMSWIHIADEIGALRFLIEQSSASGAFNLTAPNPVTNREMASTLGIVMRRPAFMPAPRFAFQLAFGEVATIVVDGQRVLPQRLMEMGYKFKYTDLEVALRDLLS